MSELAEMQPAPQAGMATTQPRRRSYVAGVVVATFGNVGAILGGLWLGLIALFAVFGPFIASSHPYVMRTDAGSLRFPLFRYLSPIDIALPLIALAAVGAWFLPRLHAGGRFWSFLGATSVILIACLLLADPPELEVLSQYREMEAAGEIEWAINAPIPFSATDYQRDLRDIRYASPSLTGPHFFGTDANGADVLSRLIHASRIAIAIGFIATGLALSIGIVVGGLMGYFSRLVDLLGMRVVEIFAAIPSFFLLLTLAAVIPPEWTAYRLYIMMVIIGVTSWVGYCRFIRAEFLKLREQDFVQAARALGLPLRSILFRHMLPNGVAPVLVEASFGVAAAILYESVLSFLGLGLINEPSWGQMLSQATGATGDFKWWMAVFPGMAIFLTVFAFNLIGEALRDVIDPRVGGTLE